MEKTMTPYQYVNNNPVRYIDPDGMAAKDIIYLNSDGSINRVVNDGKAHIRIVDPEHKGKNISISSYYINREVFSWNNRNRQVVANVAGYYRKKAGLDGKIITTYKVRDGANAYESNGDTYIPSQNNGRPSEELNNKYNLMKTLFHENRHSKENITGAYKYSDHAKVNLDVMQSIFFTPLSNEMKVGEIIKFTIRVGKAKDAGEKQYLDLINSFNQSNIHGGYKINNQDSGGIQLINPQGKLVSIPIDAKINVKSPND